MRSLYDLAAVAPDSASAPAADPPVRPAVIGHRGLVHAAPENTLAAFRACLGLRVGFEWDVRRTKDGQLVCLHDETVDRTTNGKGRLADQTLAELRRLDAGVWFDPAFVAGAACRWLEEILELLARSPPAGRHARRRSQGSRRRLGRIAGQDRPAAANARPAGLHRPDDRVGRSPRAVEGRQPRGPNGAPGRRTKPRLPACWPISRRRLGLCPLSARSRRPCREFTRPASAIFIAGPLVAGQEPANWKRATELGIDAILTDYPLELARQLRGK